MTFYYYVQVCEIKTLKIFFKQFVLNITSEQGLTLLNFLDTNLYNNGNKNQIKKKVKIKKILYIYI